MVVVLSIWWLLLASFFGFFFFGFFGGGGGGEGVMGGDEPFALVGFGHGWVLVLVWEVEWVWLVGIEARRGPVAES